MKHGLTVNELSKFTHLSPRTIRYYDKVDLFLPSFIDKKTGYRYYNIEKLEELRLIHYMRYLDIPIKEIKNHLSNRNINDYENILKKHLKKTEDKIEHLHLIKNKLKNRMNSINEIRKIPCFEKVILEEMEEKYTIEIIKDFLYEEDWEKELGKTENKLNLPPNLVIGNICFSITKANIKREFFYPYNSLIIILDNLGNIPLNYITTLPKRKYVSIYFKGNHNLSKKYYKILMKYIKKNSLKIIGDSIECTLIDHYISSDKELHITNIKIPIL